MCSPAVRVCVCVHVSCVRMMVMDFVLSCAKVCLVEIGGVIPIYFQGHYGHHRKALKFEQSKHLCRLCHTSFS